MMIWDWKEEALERKKHRQSKDEIPVNTRKASRKKQPPRFKVVGKGGWSDKEYTWYKAATEEQCQEYIDKHKRSWLRKVAEGWRIEPIP